MITQLRYKIIMSSFGTRLREEIEYMGISQRELAERAGIKKRALDMYVGYRESMPPADVAVRLAKALNVTVEYLVTGEKTKSAYKVEKNSIEKDLEKIPVGERQVFEAAIHLYAENKNGG